MQQSEKLVKQQPLLDMSSQYGELRPTNGRDRLAGLGYTPANFNGVRVLASIVTAATSLNGNPPDFAQCLAVCRAGILCIYFREFLPPNGIVPGAKFTLRPSLAFSCFDSVKCVSQTLRHGTRNEITELSLMIIFNRGRHLYSKSGHHAGHRPTF